MIISQWDYFFLPTFIASFSKIEHTVQVKARICLILSSLSLINTIKDKQLIESDKNPRYGTSSSEFINSYARNYIIVDTFYMIYQWLKYNKHLRKDVIIHHVIVWYASVIGAFSSVATMGFISEIYSCGSAFGFKGIHDFIWRGLSILLVRSCIWYKYFSLSSMYTYNVHIYTAKGVGILMSCLDIFWLRKIIKRLYSTYRKAKVNKLSA